LHSQKEKDMNKSLMLIITGVAIGILVAPRKGSETWKKITDGLDDLKDKAKDSIDDLIDSGKDMVKKGKEGATKVSNEW